MSRNSYGSTPARLALGVIAASLLAFSAQASP